MTYPPHADAALPGTRQCPGCKCCQFGLCLLAARDMNECSSMATDPAATRDCPCSAVLRRPLISVVPHLWDTDAARCRRCGVTRAAQPVPNCWFHPHQPGRGGLCRWCGLPPAAPGTPMDCPGMPRAMHAQTGAAVPSEVRGPQP